MVLDEGNSDFLQDGYMDHEAMSFPCDPNHWNPDSPYGILKGPYSSFKRCLYGKNIHDY